MEFYENQYYHIYNRTNNEEALFRSSENYLYFLKKYRYYFDELFDTIAYCLMPTHFHFLVRIKEMRTELSQDVQHFESVGHLISRRMQTLQSSYTKAINIRFNRHGSLFQSHFKAKLIEQERYYIALAFYIHQNPVRSKLVEKPEEWEYSSYQEYIDYRKGSLPKKELLLSRFSIEEIKMLTSNVVGKTQMSNTFKVLDI